MGILKKLYHSNLKSACPKTMAGLLTHKATPCLFLSHIFCLALQLPSSIVMALIAHTSIALPWYSLFYKTSSSYGFVGLISYSSEILAWILKNIREWNRCQVSLAHVEPHVPVKHESHNVAYKIFPSQRCLKNKSMSRIYGSNLELHLVVLWL